MHRKASALLGGLFFCVVAVAEEKPRIEESRFKATLEARQRVATRIERLPVDAEPIVNPVDAVRCGRGRYSYDCAVPPAVMTKPVDLVVQEKICFHRSFLSPGWRCDNEP